MNRLFETPGAEPKPRADGGDGPLAVRMRPDTLKGFVGQEHLLAKGSSLHEAISSGRPVSMIFIGPPGSGKTTLARIIAVEATLPFEELSAVNAGSPQVREVVGRAKERRSVNGKSTVFFLDEIHRFNKAQQDALLLAVEEGLLILIGATTENPYFEINSALLSRCQIYELKQLDVEEIVKLMQNALEQDSELISTRQDPGTDVLEFIAVQSDGDARIAYNALELACKTASERDKRIDIAIAEDAMQKKALLYDKGGDKHYDYISAFIKSMRGSDPDAAIYYLAVMLEGGEDPRFIARRMVIFASEDVGNADPQALQTAVAVAHAVEHVGLPECRINMSQAATYLSLAPKSNAAISAIDRAASDVRAEGASAPPAYLQDSHYPGAKELGRGEGYDYPHSNPEAFTDQELMPDEVAGREYYRPTEYGLESDLKKRLKQIREERKAK